MRGVKPERYGGTAAKQSEDARAGWRGTEAEAQRIRHHF